MIARRVNTYTPMLLALGAALSGSKSIFALFLCTAMLINAIYDSRRKEPTNDN